MNTSSILSIPTDDFLAAQVQPKLSPIALEVIHKERESYFPLYSSVCAQVSNDKHISITEYVEINSIMRPLEGQEFWNAAFDLTSFFLAESGLLDDVAETPNVDFSAFTKRAVAKIRKNMAGEL